VRGVVWLIIVACAGEAPATAPAPPPVPAPAAVATTDDYPLFRRHAALAAIPRVRLATLPTPVERAASLGSALGIELWIKRDDRTSAVYGGGKARKLELLLAEALAAGAERVATSGGVGSHHALATALFGRQLGLEVRLYLLPQPPTEEVADTLLGCRAAGAELVLVDRVPAVADAHGIAPGGSSPLGNVAFVNAGFELAEQVRAGVLPEPDDLYVALGTMGSAAGLAIGLQAAGLRTRVIAVRASNRGTSTTAKVEAAVAETLAYLRARDPSFPDVNVELAIEGAQLGRGYARPTEAGSAAAALFAAHTGRGLDATYTAKAFAAVVAARGSGRRVLFWDTHHAGAIDTGGLRPVDLPVALRPYAFRRADR
jgi:1-aminocyclopropane-1-carboxylate deaminase/D-cysteine desulfhydrase-like pyridoxal-dependent ACC family enzyme